MNKSDVRVFALVATNLMCAAACVLHGVSLWLVYESASPSLVESVNAAFRTQEEQLVAQAKDYLRLVVPALLAFFGVVLAYYAGYVERAGKASSVAVGEGREAGAARS